MALGRYESQIIDALNRAGNADPSARDVTDSIFYCPSGPGDDVNFVATCKEDCKYGGSGDSDYCSDWTHR